MNQQQASEIAETAFKARFGDIEVVNVKRDFDRCDDPMLDVKIIYDGTVKQLIGPDLLKVRTDTVSKVVVGRGGLPRRPYVHFIAKSEHRTAGPGYGLTPGSGRLATQGRGAYAPGEPFVAQSLQGRRRYGQRLHFVLRHARRPGRGRFVLDHCIGPQLRLALDMELPSPCQRQQIRLHPGRERQV